MLKNKFGKVVVAVDKFKGSLTAAQVASAVVKGLKTSPAFSASDFRSFPLADGGDGSLETMAASLPPERCRRVRMQTCDPLGRPVEAEYLMIDEEEAFIEMAAVCGLSLLKDRERNPDRTSTYGLGEMIRHAVTVSHARRLVLAIGGSATNDGGLGMLTALGYRFSSASRFPAGKMSDLLLSLVGLDDRLVEETVPGLGKVAVRVAVDVDNPLLGENGATRVYGPQKGGTPEVLDRLERGMENWAAVVARYRGQDGEEVAAMAGAGAAGGMGFALAAVLGGTLLPGWELFTALWKLEEEIRQADLVITGEGRFDRQSLSGKLPYGVLQLCLRQHKPLWMVCGRCDLSASELADRGISRVFALEEIEKDPRRSMAEAASLLPQLLSRKL